MNIVGTKVKFSIFLKTAPLCTVHVNKIRKKFIQVKERKIFVKLIVNSARKLAWTKGFSVDTVSVNFPGMYPSRSPYVIRISNHRENQL